MAANDLLSKDEINALLYNATDDLVARDEGASSGIEGGPVNRNDRGHSITEQYPMLDIVNERFSGSFRLALSNLLGCDTEINLDGLQELKFSDYTHSLFIPTSMNIACVKPLNETILFVFDPKLVFMLVDKYFGGDGRHINIYEGREFAPTELRVIEMILEKLFVTLKDAWSPVTTIDLELISSEENPQFTDVLEPTDIVIVNTFQISIDNTEGDLHVAMPRRMLESLRNLSEVSA